MSTLVNFTPSTLTAFQFQPTLNGTLYAATIFWNIFGNSRYLQLTDLQGNLIVYRELTSSGPQLQATFSWVNNVATATCLLPHNVPVGVPVNALVSETNSLFDGSFMALSLGPTQLTYALNTNPLTPAMTQGQIEFPLNLVEGYLTNCFLFFYEAAQQFAFSG